MTANLLVLPGLLEDADGFCSTPTRAPIPPVEVLKELADGIPGASLTVIEDCGHVAALEQPARVLAALVEWLERKTT